MPLVAFTREMGSLGVEIADSVAAHLGVKVIYHEIIAPLANKMRLRNSHVVHLLEGGASLLERLTADRTSMAIYTADETFGLIAQAGSAVIRSWGATLLLRPVQHCVCVRVCAPLELRIERMQQRLTTDDRARVAKEIEASDRAHEAIVRRHFDSDWRNGEHYDLVINTERVPIEEGVEQVLRMLRHPVFQETEHSRKQFAALHLVSRARSALRNNRETAKANVELAAEGPALTLSGYVGTYAERERVVSVCSELPGVERVVNQLKVTSI